MRWNLRKTIDTFVRDAIQRDELFFLLFGAVRKQELLGVVDAPRIIRAANQEVSQLRFPMSCWATMTYRHVPDAMDGVLLTMRALRGNVRRTEYRRNALTPRKLVRPRREFPTT